MTREEFEEQIADAVDQRRGDITRVQRVVAELARTPLEQTAALMALPMLYAHWEGFVKEAVQLYIEYIEKQSIDPSRAHPTMFSFALKKKIKLLMTSGSVERMSEFAAWLVDNMARPVRFEDKTIDTGANLSYENLKALCDTLRIDVRKIESEKRQIDKLLQRRNNIAHTGRPLKLDETDVDEDAKLALKLVTTFEAILRECAQTEQYLVAVAH